jgi:hypothetical protein
MNVSPRHVDRLIVVLATAPEFDPDWAAFYGQWCDVADARAAMLNRDDRKCSLCTRRRIFVSHLVEPSPLTGGLMVWLDLCRICDYRARWTERHMAASSSLLERHAQLVADGTIPPRVRSAEANLEAEGSLPA